MCGVWRSVECGGVACGGGEVWSINRGCDGGRMGGGDGDLR